MFTYSGTLALNRVPSTVKPVEFHGFINILSDSFLLAEVYLLHWQSDCQGQGEQKSKLYSDQFQIRGTNVLVWMGWQENILTETVNKHSFPEKTSRRMADHCKKKVCGSNNVSGVVFLPESTPLWMSWGQKWLAVTRVKQDTSDTCYCFDA